MPRNTPPTPEICPVCGADVPPRALACRECGADHNTGWREDAALYDGLDLPGSAYGEADDDETSGSGGSYDEFMRREFGPKWGEQLRPPGVKWVWWIAAVLLLLAFLWYAGLGAILAR